MAKVKVYRVLAKVPGVIGRDDGTNAVFSDVGAQVTDSDPAVVRAVAIYPDHFLEIT